MKLRGVLGGFLRAGLTAGVGVTMSGVAVAQGGGTTSNGAGIPQIIIVALAVLGLVALYFVLRGSSSSEGRNKQQERLGGYRSHTGTKQQGPLQSQNTHPENATSRHSTSVPTGIKIICGLAGLGAIASVLVGTTLLGLADEPGAAGWVGTLGLFNIINAILSFVMIYGLWNLRLWGWKLAMFLYSLGILSGLWVVSSGAPVGFITVGVSSFIIYYIYNKKHLFQSHARSGRAEPHSW